MSNSKVHHVLERALITSLSFGVVYVLFRNRVQILKHLDFKNPFRFQKIEIIENVESCNRVINELKKHAKEYRVLGFDCEWVTVGGQRRNTALLQLASHRGLCALIRLCKLQSLPQSLREILEDENILKVGIVPYEDAGKLNYDYSVRVSSTLDLRFLALRAKHKPGGLGKMAKSILNIQLDKNWRVSCSDWEAKVLTDIQIKYAAEDAHSAIEIFKNLAEKIHPTRIWQSNSDNLKKVIDSISPFFDMKFQDHVTNLNKQIKQHIKQKTSYQDKKAKIEFRQFSSYARTKALYDNCFMEAPDGELLCTCDRRKADWYVFQELAQIVKNDPFTIRLNFEPAGRSVGDSGKFYTIPKKNMCVACGKKDAFIRKNVVPREYRKYFPEIMKSHNSHDILLLCLHCHNLSNISDQKIRKYLENFCDAPLNEGKSTKYIIDPKIRELNSAARALLYNGSKIPEERKKVLTKIVLDNYPEANNITDDLLDSASIVQTFKEVNNYCPHGLKVVREYETNLGGLVELEKLWREHFINTMNPKYLPELWSVNHNENRLEIRINEGRIDEEDVKKAGLSVDHKKEENFLKNEDIVLPE